MNIATALTLGRVSNLPTIWSNLLAGLVLAGSEVVAPGFLMLVFTASLLYLAGMFLNDAFDADWDAERRPERPIPRGDASAREVFVWGGLMIALALGLLSSLGTAPLFWGLALAVAIVAYDWRHKTSALAPWLMGLCRMLVYLLAASTLSITPSVVLGGAALLAYVAAITYSARTEHLGRITRLWPLGLLFTPAALAMILGLNVPVGLIFALFLVAWCIMQVWHIFGINKEIGRAVTGLIAGISLVDAALIASFGTSGLALWAVAAWACTLILQRRWAGT